MKKIFYLLMLCSLSLPSHTSDSTKLFLGSIKFPEHIHGDLCLYYKGQKIQPEWSSNNTVAQFSFLESKYTHEMFILVCDNISYQTSQTNTVQCLQAADNYQCYKLLAQRTENEQGFTECSWSVQKCTLENNNIPDNTFIFLFNPTFIDGLQVQTWNSDNTLRVLPTINIKSIQTKDLTRTMTIARLTAIDIDLLHSKVLPQGS